MSPKAKKENARKNQLLGLLLFISGLLIAVSLVTHSQSNDSRLLLKALDNKTLGDLFSNPIQNRGGVIGVFIAYSLLSVFGYLAVFIPLAVWALAYCFIISNNFLSVLKKIGFATIFLYSIGLLFSLHSAEEQFVSVSPGLGGLTGHIGAAIVVKLLGTVIAYTIAISLIIGSIIWAMPSSSGVPGQSLLVSLLSFKSKSKSTSDKTKRKRQKEPEPVDEEEKAEAVHDEKPRAEEPEESEKESKPGFFKRIIRIKKPKKKTARIVGEVPGAKPNLEQDMAKLSGDIEEKPLNAEEEAILALNRIKKPESGLKSVVKTTATGYVFPSSTLLDDPPAEEPIVSHQELEATAEALKDTLATFGIKLANGEVEIYPGPIITRFEFKPAPGVKIAQIVNLADDLALAMKAKRIRIVAPIPGKSAVGVEIPNRLGRTVYIKEIITSDKFKNNNLLLPLALGKTISGQPFVVDLAAMPHLLVAGATGTGKSVSLNCIITSLLYKLPPESIRFILIDPKMLELSVYNDLPHLEKPVVTEMKYAEKVLTEAVVEMEDRYRKLAKVGVRNIADYNASAETPIPYVVIIVDELADLMMVGSNRIETLITRLAQMARAVGIHLILATQRPSVDVITGLIKANFSTRIAFQVATKVDSRTILDINGAEKLLGRGDMLYMNPAFPEPKRVHGAYISGKETQAICRELGSQEYQPERIKNFDSDDNKSAQYDPAGDAVYLEAVKLVVKHKQGSVSLLQRRLGIGYQRAARLIDQLEENGIVGPYDGSKAREVLVDEQYVEEVFKEEQ